MKKLKVILLALLIGVGVILFTRSEFNETVDVSASTSSDRELKAVWVTPVASDVSLNGESTFKNSMNNVLDIMEYYGMNALIFHVRTHNNAFYSSSFNPKASYVSNINFNNFDPIAWLIEETHSRGIEFHAWMNPYRVATNYQVGTLPSTNPQSNSNNLFSVGSSHILDPSKQVVRTHINNTIIEFVERYPTTDAIHFDDYFYIQDKTIEINSEEANIRRGHINDLIESIHDTLNNFNQANNSHIQFGISPTGIYKNGNGVVTYDSNGHAVTTGSQTGGQEHYGSYLFADTVKWAEEGWIDYLMPQVYWARNHNVASFTKVLSWWDKVFKNLNVNLYTGIGLYMADSTGNYGWSNNANELKGQFEEIDTYNNVLGYSVYSFRRFRRDYDGVSDMVATQMNNGYTANRRKIKVLPQVKSMAPVIPGEVNNFSKSGSMLSWDAATNGKFYYIYRSSGELTFSVDEIVGVVGGSNLTYDTNDFSNTYNYGIRALSGTNHLGPTSEEEPVETYTINYNLNGGNFDLGYSNRDEMIVDFLTDFHTFLTNNHGYTKSLNTFMHGAGQTSGYDGEYFDYTNQLVINDDFSIDNSINIFIRQSNYNKWVPLMELMNEYTHVGNSTQTFYKIGNGPDGVAYARLKPFIQKNNLWPYNNLIEEIMNRIPEEFSKGVVLIESYNENTPSFDLPIPIRDNFIFIGWYKTSSFAGPIQTQVIKGTTGDLNFYAKWEPEESLESYLITFNINYSGGTNPTSQNVYEGYKVMEPANPVRTGYEFLGWYDDNDILYNFNSDVYSNFTLTAKWQVKTFTITFNLGYGGNYLPNQTVNYGQKVTKPSNPTRSGYAFLGWYIGAIAYDFNSNVNQNLTLTAKWEVITYSITYELNGGDFPPSYSTREGMIVEFLTDFYNWLSSSGHLNKNNVSLMTFMHGVGKTSGYNGLYETTYYDYLHVNGKTGVEPSTGKFINQEGYNQKWTPLMNVFDQYIIAGQNVSFWASTYTAQLRIKGFISGVSTWPNNSTTVNLLTVIPNDYKKVPINSFKQNSNEIVLLDPIREDFIFGGWYNNVSFYGTPITIIPSGSTGDKIFYAKWEPETPLETYIVTFDSNGGTNIPIQYVYEGYKVIEPINPTREGREFVGWYLNEQLFNFNTLISNDITLTAKWKIAVSGNPVEAIEAASIRLSSGNQKQGLRFYAHLDDEYKNNPHGFYLVYGVITSEELNDLINDSNGILTYNDKEIFKVSVGGYDLNNEYSVVLTEIPLHGYLTKITVVPYVIIEDELYLSSNVSTRSIYEVAHNAHKSEGLFENIIDDVNDNLYKIKRTSDEIQFISSSLDDYDLEELKEEFFNDWNDKFGTSVTGLDAGTFWVNARQGTPNSDEKVNKNLSDTRIYSFFNDSTYKDKWGWILDYMIEIDFRYHPSRQALAIQGDGTFWDDRLGSNQDILYNAHHLSYAIVNFFNVDNQEGSYPYIEFKSNSWLYNYVNDFYSVSPEDLHKGYIIKGDSYKLPPLSPGENWYFDGLEYYSPGDYIVIDCEMYLIIV